ncbi:AMP-binding protein [Streptomyces sp. MT29]|nr:AMP-binding protein [Streptomyces sp. MT29]
MTLLDVLLGAVREAPGQVTVHVHGDGSELTVTLRELLDDALHVAGGLREAGVVPGTCLPLLADRSEDFQPMFWGALAAGLVPVPLAPDARRILPVWGHLGRPPVLVDAANGPVAGELAGDVRVLRRDVLRQGPAAGTRRRRAGRRRLRAVLLGEHRCAQGCGGDPSCGAGQSGADTGGLGARCRRRPGQLDAVLP